MKSGSAPTRTFRSDAPSRRSFCSSEPFKNGDRSRCDADLCSPLCFQVVPVESQENGQKEAKRMRREDFEEDDSQVEGESVAAHEEQMDTSLPATVETQSPTLASQDTETNTGTIRKPRLTAIQS